MAVLVPALLLFIASAALCAGVGRAVAGEVRGGWLAAIAVGFVGGLLGSWLARLLRLPDPLTIFIGDQPFQVLWTLLGAALCVAILYLVSRRK